MEEQIERFSEWPTVETASALERRGGLTRRDFFDEVVERLRPVLAVEWADFQHKANSLLLKIYFDNERVHYEVWCDGERRTIEIGLHFEDGPLSTAAYLAHFDSLIVELKDDLGAQVELERWTTSWGHLYEHWPLGTLTVGLAERVAARLARLIATLQPLVDAAAIPAERSARAEFGLTETRRGAWRSRKH